ncbi:MAG: putative Zn-dependent protease, partial [Vicingaceae bacterium]
MKRLFFLFFVCLLASAYAQQSGQVLYEAGKFSEAASAFKEALKNQPNDYKLRFGLANSLHK